MPVSTMQLLREQVLSLLPLLSDREPSLMLVTKSVLLKIVREYNRITGYYCCNPRRWCKCDYECECIRSCNCPENCGCHIYVKPTPGPENIVRQMRDSVVKWNTAVFPCTGVICDAAYEVPGSKGSLPITREQYVVRETIVALSLDSTIDNVVEFQGFWLNELQVLMTAAFEAVAES